LIADDSTHLKMACGDRKVAFRVAILDPELTVTQPATVSAVTGIDSIAHAVESFVSTKRTPFSQMFSRQAWTLLNENIETVLLEPTNLAARSAMQLGAHLAGMAIENSMLGCAHSCANPLTAHYGITHGVAVGVMLPSVIRFNAEHVHQHYADLHAGGAEKLADRLRQLLRSANLATNLGDLGVSRSILPVLAEEAAQQWTAQFNPRPASVGDLARMYEAAF
jgi:alcohol dehydrogenase